jgi:hypothetical protein
MTLATTMLSLMTDTVTIEPFVSQTAAQVPTYGAAVTYRAQVLPYTERIIDPRNGRETRSTAQIIIPNRVAVDVRSRLTMPAGFAPSQPPIMAVRPIAGLNLDHTQILL